MNSLQASDELVRKAVTIAVEAAPTEWERIEFYCWDEDATRPRVLNSREWVTVDGLRTMVIPADSSLPLMQILRNADANNEQPWRRCDLIIRRNKSQPDSVSFDIDFKYELGKLPE